MQKGYRPAAGIAARISGANAQKEGDNATGVREMKMDLKDFVSQTLIQIVEGVRTAQKELDGHGVKFSPDIYGNAESLAHGFLLLRGGQVGQIVHFDVALTAMSGTGTKGGIGVVAGIFNLGSAGESKAETTNVSRVKFAVPMHLPISEAS
jgi:hypothetical protein